MFVEGELFNFFFFFVLFGQSTIAAQLQHTTQSTASAGVFVDKKEKQKNKVVIKKAKQPLAGAGSEERRTQKEVLDRVLAKVRFFFSFFCCVF